VSLKVRNCCRTKYGDAHSEKCPEKRKADALSQKADALYEIAYQLERIGDEL